MSYQLTKEEIVKEIVRCGKDPIYFLNNYGKISHPQKGLISFKTFNFQNDLLKSFKDHRFNIILKARQLGISTITAGYIVWLMTFHRDKNVLVLATKFGTASNLVKKVKNIMKNIPDWMQIANITVDNRSSFELSNGSQIKASSTSGDAGRSEALSLLVIDEAAHVEGLEELWMGLYPTLSTGGSCIALSSPNGVGNWFHKTYIAAEEEQNNFHPTKLPWNVHPDRNLEWFEKETKNMSRREIAQELECNFNMSGETVINPEDIEKILGTVCEPEYKIGFDRNIYIWEKYDSKNSYILSADVARGDGRDYSVFHVVDVTNMKQVAEYQGKPELDFFAQMLYDVGNSYGKCMMIVENNNVGYTVLTKLISMNYNNIYYSIKSSHEYIDQYTAEQMSNSVPGFTTSMKTRPLIIAKFEEFLRNNLITLRSNRLLKEIQTFIWNNGKPEAMRGYNDDLIMAMAIACWVRDTALVGDRTETEYTKAILLGMSKASSSLHTLIPGQAGYSKREEYHEKIRELEPFIWISKG
jgi:hypothetical protein